MKVPSKLKPTKRNYSLETRQKMHARKCKICNNPLKEEIEKDYLSCMPFSHLRKVYNIKDQDIIDHMRIFGLEDKRDRKKFYWKFIENVDFSKVSPAEALQASIHLDKLEGKLRETQVPSNIQIIYAHAEKIGIEKQETKKEVKDGDSYRLSAQSDTREIPQEQSQV